MTKKSSTTLDLSIIVVSYNTKDVTIQTLETAIIDLKADDLLNRVEFFIVDNNSQDGSVEAVKKFMGKQGVKYTVIANKDNRGFAWANNQAIKQSTAKAVILLNSDTITLRGAFKQLFATFEQHPINETTAHSAESNQADRHPGTQAHALAAVERTQTLTQGGQPGSGSCRGCDRCSGQVVRNFSDGRHGVVYFANPVKKRKTVGPIVREHRAQG